MSERSAALLIDDILEAITRQDLPDFISQITTL